MELGNLDTTYGHDSTATAAHFAWTRTGWEMAYVEMDAVRAASLSRRNNVGSRVQAPQPELNCEVIPEQLAGPLMLRDCGQRLIEQVLEGEVICAHGEETPPQIGTHRLPYVIIYTSSKCVYASMYPNYIQSPKYATYVCYLCEPKNIHSTGAQGRSLYTSV